MAVPFARVWDPAAYQGRGTSRRYFEGWYFKHVDAGRSNTVAVIPGVSFSSDGSARHSFVQVVTSTGTAHYFAYPADAFEAEDTGFDLRVGPNRFWRGGMSLDLDDGVLAVRGAVSYGPWSPWPVTALSPGVMGWYRFVPRMETYHGVLSMDHEVAGSLEVGGERFDLSGGRGYAEKDWGTSFPSSWVWAQSNSFESPGTSVTISVAKVPWMTGAFVGTIAGLLLDGRLHRFATYTGARLTCIETDSGTATIALADRREELEVSLHGSGALQLKAPVLGSMEGRDAEALGGTLDVSLRALRGGRAGVVFRGTGLQAGVEVMNDKDELGRVPCSERGAVESVGPDTGALTQ